MENIENVAIWKRTNQMFGLPREQWRAVDHIIYGTNDYFYYDLNKIKEMRFNAIKESLNHHYNNSRFYNQLCKEYNFTPDSVNSEEDFDKIPMLPDTFFKEYPSENPKAVFDWLTKISTIQLGQYDYQGNDLQGFLRWAEKRLEGLVNHSSGTTGHYSFMFRDKLTFQRFYYAAVKTLLAIPEVLEDEPHYVYPGSPNTFLTIGKWLGEAGKVFDPAKRHFLTDREISMTIARLMSTGQAKSLKEKLYLRALGKAMKKGEEKMLDLLQDLDKKGEQSIIISPPFQLYSIMLKMQDRGIHLDLGKSNSVVYTGGGWKIFENRKVPLSEFADMVNENLGIPKKSYVDVYGMSEMNGLALSCEGGYKHLSPWIYPMVLDDNQGIMGYNTWGRFAFLDPVAFSYPGYIITGDRVRLLEKCPECGKPGPVLDADITRMQGAEGKGCANLMRGLLAKEFSKVEKQKGS
jgi:phenylacetate-coenzyme A ligase PaaK-like adenylate-forming protein